MGELTETLAYDWKPNCPRGIPCQLMVRTPCHRLLHARDTGPGNTTCLHAVNSKCKFSTARAGTCGCHVACTICSHIMCTCSTMLVQHQLRKLWDCCSETDSTLSVPSPQLSGTTVVHQHHINLKPRGKTSLLCACTGLLKQARWKSTRVSNNSLPSARMVGAASRTYTPRRRCGKAASKSDHGTVPRDVNQHTNSQQGNLQNKQLSCQ